MSFFLLCAFSIIFRNIYVYTHSSKTNDFPGAAPHYKKNTHFSRSDFARFSLRGTNWTMTSVFSCFTLTQPYFISVQILPKYLKGAIFHTLYSRLFLSTKCFSMHGNKNSVWAFFKPLAKQ